MRTGVPGFDEIIQGGLPEGSCVVLEGPSGVEKESFVSAFIAEGIKKGEAILVVLSSKPPAAFFEELRAKGFDVDQLFADGCLRVVDWYSQKEESVVEVEEEGLVIKVSLDLLNVGIAITRAISSLAKNKPKRAVVEILSTALSVYDLSQVHTFAQATKAKLTRQNITSIFIVEKEMHDSTTLSTLVQPFDGVIEMDRTREGDKIVRKLAVLSLKGTAAQSKYLPFEVTHEGNIEFREAKESESAVPQERSSGERSRDASLWFSLGKALIQSGRYEKALVALESCVKIDQRNVDALRLMAEALEKLGRTEEADKVRLSTAEAIMPRETPKATPKTPGRPSRVFRILETSETRLSQNPNDADALFAKATALAALERYDDSMMSLNELTRVNHRYPGLWLLKAKIYSSLGDERKAKLCRDRSDQTEKEIAAEEAAAWDSGVRFACPLCNAAVAGTARSCDSCGVQFDAPTELKPSKPEPLVKPPEKPEPQPEISKVTEHPLEARAFKESTLGAPKGRTNGLGGRTNGLTNGLRGRTNGLTNGLRGRTNGLTNGLRGRTNGLTNGLRGRTNGLTNGLRGRTNGLTNGLRGRTNGLTNGVMQGSGKVNGLTTAGAGAGVTNGLVNGLRNLRNGITNGLTNGNGFTNGLGSGKFSQQAKVNRWKIYMMPLAAIALVLLPVMLPTSVMTSSPYSIEIDGDFSDWSNKKVIAMQTDPTVTADVRINRAGVIDDLDHLSLYVAVEGSMLQGGPAPIRMMDAVRMFIDADRVSSSGYLIRDLGADFMAEIWGWGGVPHIAKLWRYLPGAVEQHNWSGWDNPINIFAGISGGQLETEVPWSALEQSPGTPVAVRFQAKTWDGQEQFSEHILSNGPGLLQVSERSVAGATLSGTGAPLLAVELTSLEGDFAISDLKVQIDGTTPLTDISLLRLMDSAMNTLDSRAPASRQITFHPTQPIMVDDAAVVTMTVVADIAGSAGTTLGASLPPGNLLTLVAGTDPPSAVTRLNLTSSHPLGYVGFIPAAKTIDGGFEDWTAAENDPQGETSTQGIESIDIASFDSSLSGDSFFYMRLVGEAMAGTATPQPSIAAPNQSQPTVADSDRDSVPDTDDLYPFDFNNDGIPDSSTNHDVDGDSIPEYPTGADVWLNTTIPGSFPAPYAGRIVSIYIGKTTRPLVKGEDSMRFYVDVDNSTTTGYAVMGVGADYMIELKGREGSVLQSGVYRHNSPNQNQWIWTRFANAVYALRHERIEVSGSIPGVNSDSRVVYETTDWREAAGDQARSSTRGLRGISVDGNPAGTYSGVDTYTDERGQTRRADLRLAPIGGEYAYAVEKNGMAAYFGSRSSSDAFSLLTREDMQFAWKPSELGTISGEVYSTWRETADTAADTAGSQIAYRDLFPMVDDMYTVGLNMVKHDVVFRSASSIPYGGEKLVVRGDVRISNGSVFMSGGTALSGDYLTSQDLQVVSPSGVLLTLRTPVAYEQGDKEARVDGSFRVQKSGAGWLLSMEAPLGWFTDAKRKFPVVFDPTGIIDTSSSSSPTSYNNQRKMFHDGTYFWMFYYDGSQTQYEYSSDGMSWVNSRTQAFTTSGVQMASVWYHDTGSTKIVYITGDTSAQSVNVYARRGTISGTTITWGTEATVAVSAFSYGSKVPTIIRASNDYLWVSAIEKQTGTTYNFVIARSTNTDDVSSWQAYTRMFSSAISTTYIGGAVVPLTGGDVYAAWYRDGTIEGKKYTWGGSWGSIESIDTTLSTSLVITPSILADGSGYVHMAYISSSGYVLYRQRTSSWSGSTTLNSNSGNTYPTISTVTSSGDLYAFWKASSGQITASKYSSSAWSSQAIETSTITKSWVTSIYNISSSSNLCWAWTDSPAQHASTRDIRFSMISTSTKSVTVDTSTISGGTQYSQQRRIVHDGTYFWAFYDDGTSTYYTYSADGETWMNTVTLLFTTSGIRATSVWLYTSGSNKYVYAVGDDTGVDKTVVVKRGSISGTTITWGSDYTVTVSTKNVASKVSFISRDASGYIWIASNEQESNNNFAAVRSTNTDDVSAWGTFAPLMAADTANNYVYGVILPLASGDMYAVWYADGTIYGKKYTASNTTWWTSQETINTTSTTVNSKGPSVVVDSNYYVNLVFVNSTGRVIYRQRTTSWGTATVVATTSGNTYPSITLQSNDLYVFWIDSTYQITAKKYSSGSWSSVSGIDTSTTTKGYITTIYSAPDSGTVCWVWTMGSGSPYEVKFAVIPEFEDVAVPLVGVGLLLPMLGKWRRANRRGISRKDVPRQ